MLYRDLVRNKRCAVLLNQQNGHAELYDLNQESLNEKALLLSFETGYATGLKLRYASCFGGDCLFVSTIGAAVFSLDTAEKLWEAPPYAENPHSIEWIEYYGILCLACSSGSALLFYHVNDPSTPYAELTLSNAHGVLWDEKRECLWATGDNLLQEIRFDGDRPYVEQEHFLPSGLGETHDLAAVYGNTDMLWITCNSGQCIVQYDKIQKRFIRDFPGWRNLEQGVDHKGIGNFEDGSIAYIYPNGKAVNSKYHTGAFWLTDRISLLENNALRTLISPTGLFYKLRICNVDYQ